MNRTFSFARFYRLLGLGLLFFIGIFPAAWAQGFFTTTSHGYQTHDTRFEILSDGYLLKNSFTTLADGAFFFGNLHLNSAGEEIAWDSIVLGTGVMGPSYIWLPDNDFLEFSYSLSGLSLKIQKLHPDGTVAWAYPPASVLDKEYIDEARQNTAGEIFLASVQDSAGPAIGAQNFLLRKFDNTGNLLWTLSRPLYDTVSISSNIFPTNDGGCIYNGYHYFPNSPFIVTLNKVSATGQIVWEDTIDFFTTHLQENEQGDIFSCEKHENPQQQHDTLKLEKRNSVGEIVWTKNLEVLFQRFMLYPMWLTLANNGNVLIIGSEYADDGQNKIFLANFSTDGNLLWKRYYPLLSVNNGSDIDITGAMATPDNGFIIAGSLHETREVFVLKIDANGNIYPGQISGQLALDANVNCLNDSSEQALANWKVQLLSDNYSLYTTTDSSGYYEIQDVPGDDYLLSAVTSSNLWESCLGEVPVAIPDTGSLALVQDLPIQIVADCPFMTIDIATPALRRCFSNNYSVHYCNNGTIAADSASVQIILDPFLDFTTASIPYTQQDDTLCFSLGSVPSLECGDFNFTVTVNCDSAQLGQTLCVSAHIFPDSICHPSANWTGALLEGSGFCAGDSVRFQLRNIGVAPTSSGLNFIIADDHVIMLQQPLPTLLPNDIHNVVLPADGSTWRLLADQEPNAPGMEMPSIGVEGCGTSGPPNWGFFLQFANRDGNPFTDNDCREVVGSYDPNDKQAFPIGLDNQHFIERNTPLDYQIRFQNTGTDTAFTVVVKDTLSAWLDPATVRPGAASHPYTWSLSGAGILTFTFDHILLPDSNVNEVASHGFTQFSIAQRPDNPFGAVVENRAGIYFDFNAPIMTNTVWHTISPDFKPTPTHEPKAPVATLQVWPNPADEVTRIWAERHFKAGQQIVLRNISGSVVREIAVQGQIVELQRAGLPKGLYFLEWRDKSGVIGVGKVVWE